MEWLHLFIERRLHDYFQSPETPSPHPPAPPIYPKGAHVYADLLHRYGMGLEERLLLALGLAPHISPQSLDIFLHRHDEQNRHFTEFGGVKGTNHHGFLPTGETALFLLAGDDLARRFRLLPLLEPDHYLYRDNILRYQRGADNDPPQCGSLLVAPAFLRFLITGEEQKPDFSTHFPARRITTPLGWEDLILDPAVMEQVQEIRAWARHGATLLGGWGLGRRLAPGFRALFHGPPGTGKTLTACLLGQAQGVDVYRVDLSQIVSKYIGETEKNLSGVFDQAADKNWILFFDEADALFGQRTQTSQANDRYANQEVSYLLQRVEDFPGVILLATNFRANLDDAFSRRLQSSIYFSPPDAAQRRQLWARAFPKTVKLERQIKLDELARQYELTGGQIVNVVRHAALKAAERGPKLILLEDLQRGIRRELEKEGRAA